MSWESKTLGEISLSIQTGPFGSQLHQSDYSDDGTPVVMPKDLMNGTISEESIARVSKEHVERLEKHKIQEGDILYSRRGDVGRCAFTSEREKGWLCGTGCLKVRIDKEKAEPKFVFFQLQKAETIGWVVNHAVGSTMLNLNTSILNAAPVEVPEIEIQRKIVSILAAYDELIENNRKQIKLLEEAARRLYKEWFVDLHFPGYEDVKIVDGLPEGWEKCSIMDNDVFIFAKSKITPFEGLKLYYATADVTGTEISGDGVWVTFQNKPSRAAIKPINDSVWFARMSNSYKILCCYGNSSHLSETTIISSGFAGFTAREGCFGFVFATIASKWFDKEKNRYATGATQVSLTNEGLKKIQVVLPTKNVAEEYSRIVEPYIEKAEQLKRSIKLLSQARDRLLPKLMSGKIEV